LISKDLVLRLDVAVLGNPQINPDPRFVGVLPVQPGISDRLVAAIDPDTARPRASPQVFPSLIAAFVKAADPGKRLAHIADLVFRNPATTVQQTLAELVQRVSVGCRQPDSRQHNPLIVRQIT
jgi:hypothetical protein